MTTEIKPPTGEDVVSCIWNGSDELTLVEERAVGEWRHGTEHRIVVSRFDGTLWALEYRSTPNGIHREDGFETPQRVYPHQKTITEYTTEP